MIRKRTAIFFILLANIIILVHAVVPHHYHQMAICVNTSHCQSDSNAHDHDHEHDGEENSQSCVLKQAVFIPSTQENQFSNCLYAADKPLATIDFQAVLFDNGYLAGAPCIVSWSQTSFDTSSFTEFIAPSLGLRAPPIV